jgi:hypothetical protein
MLLQLSILGFILSMLVFWVETPCGLAGRYQRFGGTYCLHLRGYIETVCYYKTLVSNYKSTRHYNPKDQHRHLHRRENLTSLWLHFNFKD